MERLTKENFWNECYSKWPGEMQVFCTWIDEYKKRVGWSALFKESDYPFPDCNYTPVVAADKNLIGARQYRVPKYHDLPIAMQIGIFLQFTFETHKRYDFFDGAGPLDMDQFVAGIKDWFFHEHEHALRDQQQQKLDSDFGVDDYEFAN